MKKIIFTCLLVLFIWNCGAGTTTTDNPTTEGTGTDSDPATETAPTYTLLSTADISTDWQLWSIPVYDGTNIVVSTEKDGTIYLLTYDSDLTQIGTATEVASSDDTYENDDIADHKHIFQNGYHYITFSTSGTGSGGYLYLMKLDTDFTRESIVTVVSDDDPTNDMILVGDGTNVYVGKFEPGFGHTIYKYDGDLTYDTNYSAGGSANSHSNGAAALYYDSLFYIFANNTLAPGEGDYVYKLVWDTSWEISTDRAVLIEDEDNISLTTGASFDTTNNVFIIHYTRASDADGGDIYQAIYNTDWTQLADEKIIEGSYHRPHSLIVGDKMYLGYDSHDIDIFLKVYQITPGS